MVHDMSIMNSRRKKTSNIQAEMAKKFHNLWNTVTLYFKINKNKSTPRDNVVKLKNAKGSKREMI